MSSIPNLWRILPRIIIQINFLHQENMARDKNQSLLSDQAQNIDQTHQENHIQQGKYLKSMIFGGLDGAVNTLAVILGGISSGASPAQILAFGISVLIGDGLGMGLGEYLSTKAEKQFIEAEQRRQKWQFENKYSEEVSEFQEIYLNKGYSSTQATKLAGLFATNGNAFANIMMLEELGLVMSQSNPLVNGLVTLLSFCLFGAIPMLPYVYGVVIAKDETSQYLVICLSIATVMFFALGYAKAAIVKFKPWRSALETLVLGALAVGAGYGMGLIFS